MFTRVSTHAHKLCSDSWLSEFVGVDATKHPVDKL